MNISEMRYDKHLNPVKAEISITLNVLQDNECLDYIARGALEATNSFKDSAAPY